MDFHSFDTPLGTMALAAEDGAITRLYLLIPFSSYAQMARPRPLPALVVPSSSY